MGGIYVLKHIKITRHLLMGILLFCTITVVLSDLAFSVTTFHDIIAVIVLVAYFIYYLIADLKEDRHTVAMRIKAIFNSGKWLYTTIAAYLIFDIITVFYTKDIFYTIKKLPYLLEFMSIAVISIYFCSSKKRQSLISMSVALSGIFVAIGSYIYYFSSMAPIYFKRLSTARDYNVFACLLLFSMIFAYDYLVRNHDELRFFGGKHGFLKRLSIFIAVLLVVMPSFYLAGSRRMVIMLPYLIVFALIYELCRGAIELKSDKSLLKRWGNIAFILSAIIIYLASTTLLPIFTDYATTKEADYKAYVESTKDNPDVKPPKKPATSYNETTISQMLETIEDKSMLNKRSLIYDVAFGELRNYSVPELIFGRGAAYDIYMYYTTDDTALLDAYSISEKNPRGKMWLSAHNFLLADILNGGIIKLILGLFLVAEILIYSIKSMKLSPICGVPIAMVVAFVVSNNFISGAFGMMNDIFFYIVLATICTTLYNYKTERN